MPGIDAILRTLGDALVAIFLLVDRGLVGALAGFAFGHFMQTRRDGTRYKREKEAAAKEDDRRRRDAKVERVRASFQVIISAAWGMRTAASELRWNYAGETDEQKRVRIDQLLNEAMDGINSARARLALEEDTGDVLDEFDSMRNAFVTFAAAMNAGPEPYGGVAERAEVREESSAKIKPSAEKIEKMLRERLSQLEKSAE